MPLRLLLLAILPALLPIAACSDADGEDGNEVLLGSPTAPEVTPESTETATATPMAPETVPPTSTPESATSLEPSLTSGSTDRELEEAIDGFTSNDSAVSVVVRRLDGSGSVAINSDATYYTASLFKVFVMYEVYRQRDLGSLSFDEEMEVTQEWIDLALGPSQYTTPGELVTIQRALSAMITLSDNVTANMLADRAGWDNIRASVARLGLDQTVLGGGELLTTAADMGAFMEALYDGEDLGRATSDEMIALLAEQKVRDRIPKYLPADLRIANKTGSWDDVTHDAGIVYGPSGAYVIVVMVGRGSAHETIAEISRLVYEQYNPAGP